MTETGLTLFLDLEQGSRVDLETAARASLAWAKLIKDVGWRVDPFADWRVELESSQPGSLKIRSILGVSDDAEMRILIKGAMIAALIFLGQQVLSWTIDDVLNHMSGQDAPKEVERLSEADKKSIAHEILNQLRKDVPQAPAQEVYKALENDPKVRGAGVTSSASGRPKIVIPRDQFSSAMSPTSVDGHEQRTVKEQVELTLIRPVLTGASSRRWSFQSSAASLTLITCSLGFHRACPGRGVLG